MQNKIFINNSLEHIMLYGYFEHAFEFYLQHLKPHGVKDVQVVEMKYIFNNIRHSLRAGTYLKPNILNTIVSKGHYPVTIHFNDEEIFWFNKILSYKFNFLKKKTATYMKVNKKKDVVMFFDLLSNLRTDSAVEFLRKEFLKKNKS